MINIKIIFLLSLATYVACGVGWSNKNAGEDKDNRGTIIYNEGGNKFTNADGSGEQIFNQGNTVLHNGQQIDNTNKPKFNKGNYRTVVRNEGGNIFKQTGGGRQIFNQGNEVVFNGYKIDNSIHSKGKQQTPEKSSEQEPVQSNVQDLGVGDRELPSSSSNNKKSATTNLELPKNAQTNNRDAIVAPEQETIQSNFQDQGSCSSGLHSSSSNTPNCCTFTDCGNENRLYDNFRTTDLFEKDDLVVFRVGLNDSIMYWMVVKKDGQYPEPNIEDVYFTLKPCQPDYNIFLEQYSEDDSDPRQPYVHYKYHILHDNDERD